MLVKTIEEMKNLKATDRLTLAEKRKLKDITGCLFNFEKDTHWVLHHPKFYTQSDMIRNYWRLGKIVDFRVAILSLANGRSRTEIQACIENVVRPWTRVYEDGKARWEFTGEVQIKKGWVPITGLIVLNENLMTIGPENAEIREQMNFYLKGKEAKNK